MSDRGLDLPRWALEVDDGVTRTPLGDDYLRLVQRIEVDQVWDGADEIRLTLAAIDDLRRPRVVGEQVLAPGTSLVLRAGYGRALTTIGRYDLTVHEPSFGAGPPEVTVVGSDGFARLMDDSWPGDWGRPQTYTDAARAMARKYGMGFAGDVSVKVPHRKRSRRVRRGGRRGTRTSTVRTRMVKNAGDTDAKMIKLLARYSGFLEPKVRFVEARGALARQLPTLYSTVEAVDGRDVLLFRKASVQRQLRLGQALRLDWRAPGEDRPSVLDTFEPRWDTDNVPMAVRVTGVVPGPPRRLVTVEAEVVGPALLRRRSALLRQAARAPDPTRRAALLDQARGLDGQIAVTRTRARPWRKSDRRTFKNAETAVLDVLERDRKPGLEFDYAKRRKVQTARREVVRSVAVWVDDAALEGFARSWLESRLQLHQTASATARNAAGLELLYPQQAHEIAGVSPEYDGIYLVFRARHSWDQGGHRVALELERVAEAPARLRTTRR